MPEIKLSEKDTKLVVQLREHLNNKTVNLGLLENLLALLEGKLNPSNGQQRKRRTLKHSRVARHLENILGG